MAVVDLYTGIHKVLASDPVILNLLGIGEAADQLTKNIRIQKRIKPQNLATNNMPMITFYALPGKRSGQNYMVYRAPFIFEIYTKDDVSTAQRIAQRIVDLFNGVINPLMGVENFEALVESEHETEVDMPNTYCFTVVITFSVSLES